MQIHLISVGKLSKEFSSIADEYQKMIKWKLKTTEITYLQKLPPNQIKPFEAKLITQYLDAKSYKIILDVAGREFDSHEFTGLFRSGSLINNKSLEFIIGGAFGLDNSIHSIAGASLSLSRMTFSHRIARIMLLEQIYRAQTILENHPYHKA